MTLSRCRRAGDRLKPGGPTSSGGTRRLAAYTNSVPSGGIVMTCRPAFVKSCPSDSDTEKRLIVAAAAGSRSPPRQGQSGREDKAEGERPRDAPR